MVLHGAHPYPYDLSLVDSGEVFKIGKGMIDAYGDARRLGTLEGEIGLIRADSALTASETLDLLRFGSEAQMTMYDNAARIASAEVLSTSYTPGQRRATLHWRNPPRAWRYFYAWLHGQHGRQQARRLFCEPA